MLAAAKKPKPRPTKKKVPPLAGITVIDASRVLAGPYCAQILADLGATVIKIERPGTGDETRSWGPPFSEDGISAYFMSINRGKTSLSLDLTSARGKTAFKKMLGTADVLIENFRSDSIKHLGLSYTSLNRLNPKLIVCSITGFGRHSPWSDRAGYDFAIQALSGYMAITGPEAGPPTKVGVAVTDVLTGLYAANAIQAALIGRITSRKGTHIDMALMDCAVASQVNLLQAFLLTKKPAKRQGNAHLQIVPYELFATADNWLVLAVGNDQQWQRFCEVAGLKNLISNAAYKTNQGRVKDRDTLVPLVAEAIRFRKTADWQTSLEKANIPHAPIYSYADLVKLPLAEERGWFKQIGGHAYLNHPFHFSDYVSGNELPAPTLKP